MVKEVEVDAMEATREKPFCIDDWEDDSEDDDSDDEKGFIQPSIVSLLKSILNEYPDDGQILKELIQNAEDAGATEMRFLFDENSYPTTSLYHPDMAKFQGPALYAFNNATFSKEDWKGIRMIHESIKRKKPMKCGRFGLGFKSVLHMTDLPSVLSGKKLLFIDPRQIIGGSWSLKKIHACLKSENNCDQFKPFSSMIRKEIFKEGRYPKTLFRFPLRTESSQLSDTIYDCERVMKLFKSFQVEAPSVLLFLKHLTSISIYRRCKLASSPTKLFEVRVAQHCLQHVRDRRATFYKKCCSAESSQISYFIDIETCTYDEDGREHVSTSKWLVIEYKADSQSRAELAKLCSDENISLIPLVGTAVSVTSQTARQLGQVFCHLPLSGERSFVPVHINGHFAISQNRCHLKWPPAGYKVGSDVHLDWNSCLLTQLLPSSYVHLLQTAISEVFSTDLAGFSDSGFLYDLLPKLGCSEDKWSDVAEQIYRRLSEVRFLYSTAGGGRWVSRKEAILVDKLQTADRQIPDIIIEVLSKGDANVVQVPQDVLRCLLHYYRQDVTIVTPSIVRRVMKERPDSYRDLTWHDKLVVLGYAMQDENYDELSDLELLPRADGKMVAFSSTSDTAVYITTEETPAELFPGLESQLLATDLAPELLQSMTNMAGSGINQLKFLDQDTVVNLLHRVVKLYSSEDGVVCLTEDSASFHAQWFERLWQYLANTYPHNLDEFIGLTIVPSSSSYPMTVFPLSESCPCLIRSHDEFQVSDQLQCVLDLFGIHVLDANVPSCLRQHTAAIPKFIKTPRADHVLSVLRTSCLQDEQHQRICSQLKEEIAYGERATLREVIHNTSNAGLANDMRAFLRKLPIFAAYRLEDKLFVSAEEVDEATALRELPCSLKHAFIDSSDVNTERVAERLGVTLLKAADVIRKYGLEELREGLLEHERSKALIRYIKDHFSQYKDDKTFIQILAECSFVTKQVESRTELVKPSDLYDPEDARIKELLLRDQSGVFPSGIYSHPEMLHFLRHLGLKRFSQLTADDLITVMKWTDKMNGAEESKRKGEILMEAFNSQPELLSSDHRLLKCAQSCAWVPVCRNRCPNYPVSLPWLGETCNFVVAEPGRVHKKDFSLLIGSASLLLDVPVSDSVSSILGWNDKPPASDVINHFQCLIEMMKPENKVEYLPTVIEIFRYIEHQNAGEIEKWMRKRGLEKWIWHGNGFASVDSVFKEFELASVSLAPFVYKLPSEMDPFLSFLEQVGMQRKCPPDRLVQVLHQIHEAPIHPDAESHVSENRLSLSILILDHLKDHLEDMSPEWRNKILIPVLDSNHSSFRMYPPSECTFCQSHDQCRVLVSAEGNSEDGDLKFTHPRLPEATVKAFGVPTLMSRLLDVDQLEVVSCGQYESIVDRIRNLLSDYSDGVSIFKEMIQNADDAGATEVRFLYDERTNDDHRSFLIDEDMAPCQGPALWVYNDQVFTDEDFSNIQKLGAGTKADKTNKIGRFGLGFNAVYNLTDVPSFISRHFFVIFDPMVHHLSHIISSQSKPGIKIDLRRIGKMKSRISDQLFPFLDIFDFQFPDGNQWSYNATLFRLPLRTQWQAEQSGENGICPKHYSRSEMIALVKFLTGHIHDMLLFTQNVRQVSFYHLPNGRQPNQMEVIFTIRRQSSLQTTDRFLTDVSQYVENSRGVCPSSLEVVQTRVQSGTNQLGVDVGSQTPSTRHWLVAQNCGQSESLSRARHYGDGLLPVAGVAVCLEFDEGQYTARCLSELDQNIAEHNAFCFLPLPISTGFEFIVNGSFAIESNRKHLHVYAEDEKDHTRAVWNECLLSDAGLLAYKNALAGLTRLERLRDDSPIWNLWPKYDVCKPFNALSMAFYQNDEELLKQPLGMHGDKIFHLENTLFFDFSKVTEDTWMSIRVVFDVCKPGHMVMSQPDAILQSMIEAGHKHLVDVRTYDLHRFFLEIFFPNLVAVKSAKVRDQLILMALDLNDRAIDEELKKQPCIPVTPNGQRLEKIERLFDPKAKVAYLYTADEGRFPFGRFAQPDVLDHLVRLGLTRNAISWSNLMERCRVLEQMFARDRQRSNELLPKILTFMDQNLASQTQCTAEEEEELKSIPFLKVMDKPAYHPFPWRVEENDLEALHNVNNVYPLEDSHLICAVELIVDTSDMSGRVKRFLGLTDKAVSSTQLYKQLEQVLSVRVDQLSDVNQLESELFKLYRYVDKNTNVMTDDIIELLKTNPSVFIRNQFILPKHVAYRMHEDCFPFLCALQPYCRMYRLTRLLDTIGVNTNFEAKDVIGALHRMQAESHGQPLDARSLSVAVRLLTVLQDLMKSSGESLSEVKKSYGEVYMPDSQAILRPASSLSFNECSWISDSKHLLSHQAIPLSCCQALGVQTLRRRIVGNHAAGFPFGQKERLTTSLRRICESYPRQEVLREFIQNADDAGADTIHFILDKRTHGTGRIFDESWKPLQGPALCIYNNAAFSEEDLYGIQRLGEGSKKEDPWKIGQYGVGFSSAYHLTDVPSLFTYTERTKTTLCVFDPHWRYSPGSCEAEPGVLFSNVEELEELFPDVFSCYKLKDCAVGPSGCLFRLPLRSVEMASHSNISPDPVDTKEVNRLLRRLSVQSDEMLVFLKHLRTIIISEVDIDGSQREIHRAAVNLTPEQDRKRAQFLESVHNLSQAVRQRCLSVRPASLLESVEIVTTSGTSSWCVSQVCGLPEQQTVPAVITKAVKSGSLALMPIGGCAYPLKQARTGPDFVAKSYCFLPLEETTGLPLHVNGHFALGHENRGHVWNEDKSKEVKFAWNTLLCSTVIAEAYVALIEHLKQICPPNKDKITDYLKLFPSMKRAKSNWSILVKSVYTVVTKERAEVFPRICQTDSATVEWLPATAGGRWKKVLFSKQETDWLKRILIQWKAPIVESTQDMCEALEEVKVNVSFLTPENVLDALKSGPCPWTGCSVPVSKSPFKSKELLLRVQRDCFRPHYDGIDLEALPLLLTQDNEVRTFSGQCSGLVSNSSFESKEMLLDNLRFCFRPYYDDIDLEDLPLLLTQDNEVRTFCRQNQVFPPAFAHLFGQSKHLFVDQDVWKTMFGDNQSANSPVIRTLQVKDLNDLIIKELPEECRNSNRIKYDSNQLDLRWILEMWDLIFSLPGVSDTELKQALGRWCLLPVKIKDKECFISLERVNDIIYDWADAEDDVLNLLRWSGVPFLNWRFFSSLSESKWKAFFRQNMLTIDKADEIIRLLHDILRQEEHVTVFQEDNILQYILSMLKQRRISMTSVSLLRALPVYRNMNGELVSLGDMPTYILLEDIPRAGIDIFPSSGPVIFLKFQESLLPLHDFIGCQRINAFEFYTQFVFKHIEYFEDEQIAEHLYFLYNNYLRDRRNEKAREIPPNAEYYRREFLKELRQLAFLRDKSGELHQPSYFFSRDNEVFVNMCEERLAPNTPRYWEFGLSWNNWSDFLNKVGIVKEVTGELFVSLAKQLASDADTKEDKFLKSLRRKSEMMTNYLFERMELKELEKFCEQISAIKFIAQHRVADHLSALAPQRCPDRFVAFSGSAPVKYERLLWTTTSLLPAWADPSRRNDLKKLAQHLKVVDTAPVDMVADNLACVTTELSKNWCDQYPEPVVLDVFRCNYSLLDDVEAIPSDVVGRLSNEKIIIMTADHRLTKPNRTVANLSESDEIKPYLCRVPANISQFVSLFERLGMSESVTADQYVTVLSDIKAEVGEEPLKDEHRKATRKAVCGLFGQLSDRNKPAPCTGQVLYLPDEDDRLVDVCRLAFNDAPAFYCRMRKIQYVMDVSQYGLDVTAVSRCLKLLPGRMRPTFLSECVSEELVSGIAEGARDDKGTARLLNEKLSSLEFNTMVDRLMYHEAVCSQQNVDPQSLADLSQRLSVTRVFAVNCVRTQLNYKKVIPDSESTKICFVQRISEPRSELTKWHIYVDERYDLQMELLVPLADIVDKILDGRLRKSALYLLPLLANSTDKSLAEILDEFNITKH